MDNSETVNSCSELRKAVIDDSKTRVCRTQHPPSFKPPSPGGQPSLQERDILDTNGRSTWRCGRGSIETNTIGNLWRVAVVSLELRAIVPLQMKSVQH